MIEFAAGFFLIVVVILGGLLRQTTVKLRQMQANCTRSERARTEALAPLDTVPLAAFRWPVGCDPDGCTFRAVAYGKFLDGLAPGVAEQLEAAREALKRDGTRSR